MACDLRNFLRLLIVDTCSVWNILSSQRLYSAVNAAKLTLCVTPSVLFECFFKPRGSKNPRIDELTTRLEKARRDGAFPTQESTLSDLIAVSEAAPLKLGSGELSCMAVAYRLSTFAILTDDLAARNFAENKLRLIVETTPRLYGKLHFHRHLSDADHADVVTEHEKFERRPLSKYLTEMYERALLERLK